MKCKTQHITLVTSEFPPQPGGIGNHAFNLALQLSNKGFMITVIADQRSTDGIEEKAFDASLSFVVSRIKITNPRFIMYFNRVFTLFKHIKSSYHVIATGKFSLWNAACCSIFYKRNYLVIIHGTEVNFKPYLLRKSIDLSLKRFKKIIAVSNYTKELVNNLNLNVEVIPNGFNPEKWNSKLNSSLVLQGYPKLITLGNVTSRKGQHNVIKHIPRLLKRYPKLHYHCVGLKTEAHNFEILAEHLKVSDHVSFHGRKDEAELKHMLMQCNIFVMLSNETATGDVEGFGIAILEANALGIPAIGSNGCGIEDAINDGYSGVLIDADNSQAFLEAIQTLLEQKKHFESGAFKWAAKHHWEDIVVQYIRALKDNAPDF